MIQPTAAVPPTPLVHSSFYKFVPITQIDAFVAHLRTLTTSLNGSILVASEGINGMVSGPADALSAFEQALQTDPVFDGAFSGMVFKHSPCKTPPFARMKVHHKPEILPLGIKGVDARNTGINLTPNEWRELIQRDDVVLLDNRNSFEYRLGRFKSAIDPGVRNFRDFPEYVKANLPTWQAQNKKIAMYCTGGIRCEKTSAWMRDLGAEVYQLEGGIINYFAQMPDADRDWIGECFVFDNRIALDTRLEETATTLEEVYEGDADGAFRLNRARRLAKVVDDEQT
ncbi:MAG: hypothetical protein IPK97_09050 [Ahniella sp.]|nr:hypothetical protein [Ahniella sp.]